MIADNLGVFHVEKEEVDESCFRQKLGWSPGCSQVILWFHLPVLGLFFIGLSL